TWDTASNNRAILSGRSSFIINAISVTRQAERIHEPVASKILLARALKGPAARLAPEAIVDCYGIWSFAENKAAAQAFLIDYVEPCAAAVGASRWYNLPCFPQTVPALAKILPTDDSAEPRQKYAVLADALGWTTNVGHPGYATAGIDEAFRAWIIPTMFARVA